MRQWMVPVVTMGLLIALLSGCMATKGQTVGEYIDDSSITTTVKAKLANEDTKTLTRVSVQTVQGTVYLTGIVDSIEAKRRATELTWQVKGVRGVVDNLQIQERG